jgi:hypothetical protein
MRILNDNHSIKTLCARVRTRYIMAIVMLISVCGPLKSQKMPDVRGTYENYPVNMVNYWQSRWTIESVQVVVLRDPAGEQEARFDLTRGATLISLRYHGKELLFGQSAGANVEMFVFRKDTSEAARGLSPYWTAFHPSQGGNSMGVPSTVAGVACNGEKSMQAFTMMVDAGINNAFVRNPLFAVWKGKLSDTYPPGYSTPYTIQTDASWVPNTNPGGVPKFYLKLHQAVVNYRSEDSGPMDWYLEGAAPWSSLYSSVYAPKNCNENNPCSSETAPVLMAGRYQDSTRTNGFTIVVPTREWATQRAFVLENAEYVKLLYGAVWAAPRHTFAVVLSRRLKGLSAFSFDWYVCAGSWKQATGFGENTVHPGKPGTGNKK